MSEKSSGGRPEIPVNSTTARRLKSLRERHRETQKEIGDIISYGAATVARYEKGERGVGDDIISCLAQHWNVPIDYLKGYTETDNPIAYALELEAAESAGADEYAAQQRAERTRRMNFFDFCGFQYEDLHAVPGAWEFTGINADKAHRISDPRGFIDPVELSDNELTAILDSTHDFIAFECFKLIQKRREAAQNGDDRENL